MAGCGGSFFGNEEPFCHAKGTAIRPLKETDALGQCVHAEMVQHLKCCLAEKYMISISIKDWMK